MIEDDDFEPFVVRFQDMVFATAVRLLGSPADAEDVAQTVFLRAFEHFDSLYENPAAAGWLKTVTRNLCLNHLSRYRTRWRLFSELRGDDESGSSVDFESELAARPDDRRADDDHRNEVLELALRALPDHQRVPLVLYHFEDRGYKDIALLLGVSIAKVKSDIHRGRKALRTHLEDHDEFI